VIAREIGTSLILAWLALSVAAGGVLLAPFVLPPAALDALVPECQWKAKYHRECILCGMTTSFVEISRGDFRAAARHNQGSLPLFLALLANECLALGFALRQRGRQAAGLWSAKALSCRH
jgi:hypothetical protein